MRSLLTSCLCLLTLGSFAQERFGIAHSNYGGGDGIYLNPARAAGQWPFIDIRLAGADLYAWNSLVAWTDRTSPLIGEVRSGIAGQTNGAVVQRSTMFNRSHRATVFANALGPAVSVAIGRGTIGVGMRSRAYVSAAGITPEVANYMFEGLQYAPQLGQRYAIPAIHVRAAAWTEIGLNYAHILKAEGFNMVSAGVGLKYNIGHAAGAFQFNGTEFTVVDTAQLDIHEASASYGFAMPEVSAGRGWGADLGVSFERTLAEAEGYRPHKPAIGCSPMGYRYRIGLSLIDLGGIRFRNGEAGRISSGSIAIADYDHIPVENTADVDSLLATSTKWTRSKGFKVGLPTAISLQYDQRITKNTYVAFAAVQNLAGKRSLRLRRTNSLALTPRYETRYFEAALPIVVHEYDIAHPSVGFMLRFQGLVVGSDHILPFINKRDVYALDFYVRLRWMIFKSPGCKGKRAGSAIQTRNGTKGMVPCDAPAFR